MVMMFDDSLANHIGVEAAIFLNRLKYWSEKCGKSLAGEGGVWIFNCLQDWHKQFSFWSLSKLRSVIEHLEEKKIILSRKPNAKRWDQTKWYSINFAEFSKIEVSKNSLLAESTNSLSSDKPQNKSAISRGERTKKGHGKQSKNTEQDTVETLLQVWESEIPCRNEWEKLPEHRHHVLLSVFASHFKSDMQSWKEFVLYVTASPFLMGFKSDFRIKLDWAICEKNLDKILSGRYHKARISKKKEAAALIATSLEHSFAPLEDRTDINPDWQKTLLRAKNRWGVSTYISWLSELEFKSFEDGILSLKVPSVFIKNYIESTFGKGLFDIALEYFKGLKRLELNSSAENEDRKQQLEKYMSHVRRSQSLKKIFDVSAGMGESKQSDKTIRI